MLAQNPLGLAFDRKTNLIVVMGQSDGVWLCQPLLGSEYGVYHNSLSTLDICLKVRNFSFKKTFIFFESYRHLYTYIGHIHPPASPSKPPNALIHLSNVMSSFLLFINH